MAIQSASDTLAAAEHFKKIRHIYNTEQQQELIRRITGHAERLGVTVNLANSQVHSAQGETGKTRTQPRQYGGRFGTKSAVEPQVFTPKQVAEAIDTLKPGQSIKLPNNAGNVRRLSNGYQVVSPDGSTNVVVKSAAMAATKANSMARAKGGVTK